MGLSFCFGQKAKYLYVNIDSLSKNPTYSKVIAKANNGEKIQLLNINYENSKLGKVYLLFSVYPKLSKKSKFWERISENDLKEIREINLDSLKQLVMYKIISYFTSPNDCANEFSFENIFLVKYSKGKYSKTINTFFEYFTSNNGLTNYLNLNTIDTTSNSDVLIRKSNIYNYLIPLNNDSKKMLLLKKYSNDLYLFNRDIFCFIDYQASPKILKGEILKVDESYFLFKPNIGIIGKTIKKRGYKKEILFSPARINLSE